MWQVAICAAALAMTTGCSDWKKNVELNGVLFQKVRFGKDGLTIGCISSDQVIAGRPCRQGWVHLYPNGELAGFTASQEIQLTRFRIPAGTWVFQNSAEVVTVCAFPGDVEIQGHLCRGGGLLGGSEGVQTAFYADGALKEFFAPKPAHIDGIPCGGSLFQRGIELCEDGHLRGATLSEDPTIDGQVFHRGERIQLTPDGHLAAR